jgi:hypothetical protein
MLQLRRELHVVVEPHPLERVAAVSTGAPLTIGNFLGLAAETENLREWATKHSYVFIWLLYLLGRCCNWLSSSATTPSSRKAAAAILGLWVLWGPSWARCWAPFGPALRRFVPGGWALRPVDTEPTGSLAAGFMLSLMLPAVGWLVAVRDSRAESMSLPASNHHDTYHRGDRWFSTLASHGAHT